MVHIKFLTDTFNAAATNDPIFYDLYCSVRNAQSRNTVYPDLVFFFRLQLQVGWIEFLVDTHRENELEAGTTALIRERKNLIEWLVQQDKTIKHRFGQYLRQQLSKSAPLDFDPWQVHPVASLLDHLYALETDAFFERADIPLPTRQEYRIRLAIFLDYEGGWPKVYQDINIWKQLGWTEMERILSAWTQNIQSAQFHYNNGWESGGYHGHWLYLVGAEERYRMLASDASLHEMKGFLAQGQSISIIHVSYFLSYSTLSLAPLSYTLPIIFFPFPSHFPIAFLSLFLSFPFTLALVFGHLLGYPQLLNTLLTFDGIQSQQVEIRENLEIADALGLGLDRPFKICKPLPAGYRSAIMGAYPNPMAFSFLSRRVMPDNHDLVIRGRRGKRSEAGRRAKHRHDKEAKGKGALAVLASRPKKV